MCMCVCMYVVCACVGRDCECLTLTEICNMYHCLTAQRVCATNGIENMRCVTNKLNEMYTLIV